MFHIKFLLKNGFCVQGGRAYRDEITLRDENRHATAVLIPNFLNEMAISLQLNCCDSLTPLCRSQSRLEKERKNLLNAGILGFFPAPSIQCLRGLKTAI